MQATNDIAVKDLEFAIDLLPAGSDRQATLQALAASMAEVYGLG